MNILKLIFPSLRKETPASDARKEALVERERLVQNSLNEQISLILEAVKRESARGGFSVYHEIQLSPANTISDALEDVLGKKLHDLGFYYIIYNIGDVTKVTVKWEREI